MRSDVDNTEIIRRGTRVHSAPISKRDLRAYHVWQRSESGVCSSHPDRAHQPRPRWKARGCAGVGVTPGSLTTSPSPLRGREALWQDRAGWIMRWERMLDGANERFGTSRQMCVLVAASEWCVMWLFKRRSFLYLDVRDLTWAPRRRRKRRLHRQ